MLSRWWIHVKTFKSVKLLNWKRRLTSLWQKQSKNKIRESNTAENLCRREAKQRGQNKYKRRKRSETERTQQAMLNTDVSSEGDQGSILQQNSIVVHIYIILLILQQNTVCFTPRHCIVSSQTLCTVTVFASLCCIKTVTGGGAQGRTEA